LPNVPEDYVHRIGRTGRAGSNGVAVSLVCVDEHDMLKDIERLIKQSLPREVVPGFEPDPNAVAQPIQLRSQQAQQKSGQARHGQARHNAASPRGANQTKRNGQVKSPDSTITAPKKTHRKMNTQKPGQFSRAPGRSSGKGKAP
jgi:ATP-dependent RNA helicase RhlE